MNNDELDNFYGGGGPDDIFGGGDPDNVDEMMGGNNNFLSFDKFLQTRENLLQGGVGKKKPKDTGSVEVVEGYDSFAIAQSSVGETGHRFISKSPYGAALKAATTLFNIIAESSKTKTRYIEFIIQKTTRGSNRKLYAYTADNVKLAIPNIIFKKDENGNRIVMNHHGQVLRIDRNNNILNVNVDGKTKADRKPRAPRATKKGKAAKNEEEMNGGGYAVYDPKTTLKHKWTSNEITEFNYKPYELFTVYTKVSIKVAVVPEELKPLKKKVVDKAKEAEKKAMKKAKEAEKKEAEKAKKAEKKAMDAEKKAMKKEKAAAKKAAEKEKAAAKKAKAPKAAKKPKSPKAKAPKAPKAPKAAKKSKSPAKAKAPRKPLAKKTKAVDGGYCGNSACGMNVY